MPCSYENYYLQLVFLVNMMNALIRNKVVRRSAHILESHDMLNARKEARDCSLASSWWWATSSSESLVACDTAKKDRSALLLLASTSFRQTASSQIVGFAQSIGEGREEIFSKL